MPWEIERDYPLSLSAHGGRVRGQAGDLLLEAEDTGNPLLDGAIALVIEEGYLEASRIQVAPAALPV